MFVKNDFFMCQLGSQNKISKMTLCFNNQVQEAITVNSQSTGIMIAGQFNLLYSKYGIKFENIVLYH